MVALQWPGAAAPQPRAAGIPSRKYIRKSRRMLIMNIKVRGVALSSLMMSSLMTLALASTAATTFAQTPAKSISDQLVGHWQLVSVVMNGDTSYGANPHGSMFFDAAGHYAAIVLSDGRDRSISYFGTYAVSNADNSVIFHVDGSSLVGADGKNQKLLITFSGDEMIQATAPTPIPVGDLKVTWKRSN
jgi:Lipocalin-like domain